MKNTLPKILMLGWEFPPVINGGLGIACHDLATAMSKHANISMIIPKSSPGFMMKELDLIGLNTIDANTLKKINIEENYNAFSNVEFIPSDLDPYYNEFSAQETNGYIINRKIGNENIDVFNIDNLYGGDVIGKVHAFSNMAAKVAGQKDFDVIHAHDWMTMVAGTKIKAQTGKPLVLHVHSLETDRSGEKRGWVYETEKQGMEQADLIIPVSNYTGNNIKQHYGIKEEKIATVHNGIRNTTSFKSKRIFNEKTVLFVGRLTRQKGPEHFLEIASRIIEVNQDVRFIMAGTGDYLRKLIHQSSYKRLGNRFHLTGFLNLNKIRYLLSIADVYCMPSLSEPFGLSAVEAAQFGIPCVISKQSGVAEVLTGSLKFDFWDINKAADNILNLLKDKVLKSKIVDDANQNLHNINWDISAKKVMNAYYTHRLLAN